MTNPVPDNLRGTIDNRVWLRENEQALKALFPETWTHVENLNGLELGFGMKLIGIDWRSTAEFSFVLIVLEKLGLTLRDGLTVRRNPGKPSWEIE